MARSHFVKKARKPIPEAGIKEGDSYYWWKFKNCHRQVSKNPPKQSQLTRSSFLSTVYEINERISSFSASSKEEFDDFKKEITDELESLRDETQSSLDAMPEQLQSSSTGELLQERIDGIKEWLNEIEGVECEDYDEEDIRNELIEENEDNENYDPEDDVINKIEDIAVEAIHELQNTSCPF